MKNVLIIWASQIFAIILNFTVQVLLANFYSVEETGIYFSVIYLMNVLSTLGLYGINNYYIYKMSKDNFINSYEKKNIFIFYMIMNVLSIIIFLSISMNNYQEYKYFILSNVFLLIMTSSFNILASIYQINGNVLKIGLSQVYLPLIKVVSLISGIYFLNKNFQGYSITLTIIFGIFLVVIIKQIIQQYEKSAKLNTRDLRSLLIILTPYGLLNVFFLLYTQGNTLYLSFLEPAYNVAYFAIAYLFLNTILIFPTAIFQRLYAHRMIKLFLKDKVRFQKIFKELLILSWILSLGLMVIVYVFADFFIITIFSEKYIRSVQLLHLLVLCIPFRILTVCIGNVMNTNENVKKRVRLELFITAVNLILNLIMIKIWSLNGAVLTVIITEMLMAFIYLSLTRRILKVYIEKEWLLLFVIFGILILLDVNSLLLITVYIILLLCLNKKILKKTRLLWNFKETK